MKNNLCPCGKKIDRRSKVCRACNLKKMSATKPTVGESNERSGDEWVISLPKTRISTLEELIKHCKVDLEQWEVERFVVNKWEMGYTDSDKEASSIPLFQVKAWLRKRRFEDYEAACNDNARLRRQLEKLKLDSRADRDMVKRLAVNHAGHDDLLANVKEFVSTLGTDHLPVVKVYGHRKTEIKDAVSANHSEDAVLLLSDTHFGDQIRREDTSGFPEFDLTIAGNRLGHIVDGVKKVLTLHREMYPIKKLYIWVGGDIGNGTLHDAPQSNQLFLPAQVHFSYNMLKFAIEDLMTLMRPDSRNVQVIEKIVLLFTVGNHMRLDEKMPTKFQSQRTLDWLIYQFVIEKFKGHPLIDIRAETSPYIFETIRGHRHLFAHGMQVGYRNSPDAQCKSMSQFIDRVRALFDSPEWRRKNNLTQETFSRICIGDIHVPVSFPRLISNGSLNGQNELGVNWTLEPIPAGQQLFGVSESHMETWKYFLDCSHIQREPGDFNAYGEYAKAYAENLGR